MKKHSLALLLSLIICSTVVAQETFADKALGDWQGTGQLFGTEAQFTMTWEKVLNNKFLKLTFQNKFQTQNGQERVMDAQAYYDTSTGKGRWFDSRGQSLPLLLEMEENTLRVLWGNSETEQGKTVYVIVGEKMAVEDYVMKEGDLHLFGKAEYIKGEN